MSIVWGQLSVVVKHCTGRLRVGWMLPGANRRFGAEKAARQFAVKPRLVSAEPSFRPPPACSSPLLVFWPTLDRCAQADSSDRLKIG